MDETRTKQLREEEADLIVQLSERVEGFLQLLSKTASERDALKREIERLKVENTYLRQFSNPGEVVAVADQINAEQAAEVERLREALKMIKRRINQYDNMDDATLLAWIEDEADRALSSATTGEKS